MIEQEQFHSQLCHIYESGQLEAIKNCEWVRFDKEHNALYSRFKLRDTYSIETMVKYEPTFHEPQLCYRLWEQTSDMNGSYILNYKLSDMNNTFLPPWWKVNLDLVHNEPWFQVAVCDTADVVGVAALDKDTYMARWVMVYLLNWIGQLSSCSSS